jgi:hypothetical protein
MRSWLVGTRWCKAVKVKVRTLDFVQSEMGCPKRDMT